LRCVFWFTWRNRKESQIRKCAGSSVIRWFACSNLTWICKVAQHHCRSSHWHYVIPVKYYLDESLSRSIQTEKRLHYSSASGQSREVKFTLLITDRKLLHLRRARDRSHLTRWFLTQVKRCVVYSLNHIL